MRPTEEVIREFDAWNEQRRRLRAEELQAKIASFGPILDDPDIIEAAGDPEEYYDLPWMPGPVEPRKGELNP